MSTFKSVAQMSFFISRVVFDTTLNSDISSHFCVFNATSNYAILYYAFVCINYCIIFSNKLENENAINQLHQWLNEDHEKRMSVEVDRSAWILHVISRDIVPPWTWQRSRRKLSSECWSCDVFHQTRSAVSRTGATNQITNEVLSRYANRKYPENIFGERKWLFVICCGSFS